MATLTLAVVAFGNARPASAGELATAQGAITISEPHAGTRSPFCAELIVEARGALDNHLISQTHAAVDADGACRYAVTVPAQTAVWIRLRPALVQAVRSAAAGGDVDPAVPHVANVSSGARERATTASVGLRFTVIAPNTFFFAPGEEKTVPLTY